MQGEPVFTFPGDPNRRRPRWRGWRRVYWLPYALVAAVFILARMIAGIAWDFFHTTFGVIVAFVIVFALVGTLLHLG